MQRRAILFVKNAERGDGTMDTKGLITQAFVRLLEKVPFEKITTQMILDEGGVSRSTFYHHFQDKYHVMTWYYQSQIERLQTKYGLRDYRLLLIDFCTFVKDNHTYFTRSIRTTGMNSFFAFLSDYVTAIYQKLYKEELHIDPLSAKQKYQILMIVEGSNAILREYILTNCKESPSEMADCLIGMLPEELRQAIRS